MTFEALKDIRGKWEAFYTKSSKEATPLLCVVRTSWRRSLGWPVRTAMWIGSRWNHYRFAKIFSIRNHVKSKISWLVQGHKDKLGGPSSNIPNWKNMDPEMTAWRAVYAFCNLNGFSTNCLVSCYLKWTISYRKWVSSRSEDICIYIYTGKGQKSHQPLGMIETCLSALDR